MHQQPWDELPQNTGRNVGNIDSEGDDNIINIVQGDGAVITIVKTKVIQLAREEVKQQEFKLNSPYKGLEPFGERDHDRFFGRHQFVAKLARELGQSCLILVLGASGSGKSSVIRAGLIPSLVQTYGSRFVELTFTPSRDPFEGLYASLRPYVKDQAELARTGKEDTLIQVIKTLKSADAQWLIFIDQFEELFTTSLPEKQQAFLVGLVRLNEWLIKSKNHSVQIVATMRSDFSDQLNDYPKLVDALKNQCLLVTGMHSDELRLAIEQPAIQHGVVYEPELVEEIVKDVQGQAGYLPLLQYTLNLLWEKKYPPKGSLNETLYRDSNLNDRTFRLDTYLQLGGVREALQQHMDTIYEGLPKAEQLAAQRVFLKLVEIGGDEQSGTAWKPVRKRALRSQFEDDAEKAVLTKLIDQKLLISNAPVEIENGLFSTSQDSTVEIAHEVLLTSWTTLNQWITDNRQAIALRNRLDADVKLWRDRNKAESELWSGAKLAQALELGKSLTFQQVLGGFTESANQFIEASFGLQERIQKREIRRARRQTIAVTVTALAIVGAIGFSWRNAQRAQKDALDAWSNAPSVSSTANLNILQSAEKQAESYEKAGEIDQALAYYRRIRSATLASLHEAVKPEDFETLLNVEVQALPQTLQKLLQNDRDLGVLLEKSKNAEKSMTKLIEDYRLEPLKADLRNKNFGEVRPDAQYSDLERQYTEGALQKTYSILFQSNGAGADLDGNGRVNSQQEAAQIPCQILIEIERLWHEDNCSWLEADPNLPYSPKCKALNQKTLTIELFSDLNYYPIAVERIKACKARAET